MNRAPMHPRACLPSGVRICILALIALGFFSHGLFGQVGREFPELKAKDTTYRNVRVISRSPVSITVRHSGGIAQVPLKDLPVEIQADFGFVSEDAEAFEERLRAEAGQAAAGRRGKSRHGLRRSHRCRRAACSESPTRLERLRKSVAWICVRDSRSSSSS